eukprot:TRINITY_DN6744_c0_g1_i1.p1 TRINITY_DN6744_c0_g1~~TRINITY_DN6744_c0_g1_i1.p1  ORF type:complete len:118 (-),score=15.80 TRINITY_DN6744_c0_g1_i1:9-362(-)
MDQRPRIDTARLHELGADDKEFLVEILTMYEEMCNEKSALLLKSIEDRDTSATKHIYHIKSSSLNLGMNPVYNICETIVSLCEKNQFDEAMQSAMSLKEEIRLTICEIESFLEAWVL